VFGYVFASRYLALRQRRIFPLTRPAKFLNIRNVLNSTEFTLVEPNFPLQDKDDVFASRYFALGQRRIFPLTRPAKYLNIRSVAHEALEEADEAAHRITYRLRKLWKRLDFM
jgi:hypothetical protein